MAPEPLNHGEQRSSRVDDDEVAATLIDTRSRVAAGKICGRVKECNVCKRCDGKVTAILLYYLGYQGDTAFWPLGAYSLRRLLRMAPGKAK